MSRENPNVLYIGVEPADGARLVTASPHTWHFHLPTSLMQTLGTYIWYVPDVTIIDMCAPYAADAYQHLRTVDAEPIILLTDDSFRPADARVYTLPRDASHSAIITLIRRLTATRTRLVG